MESSGTVQSDSGELVGKLNNYSSIISELGGDWKGKSHDNLLSKATSFLSEYGAIQNQMIALANACSECANYESIKSQISKMEAARASAVEADQPTGTYDRYLSMMNSDLTRSKNSILGYLSTASATKLEATPISLSLSSAGITMVASGTNKAFVDSLMSEVGNTISNYSGLGFHDGLWCADFASEMLRQHGYNIPRCSVAGDGTDDYDIFYALRNNGSVVHLDVGASVMGLSGEKEYDPNYSPQPGDVVLFNWDADGSTDHVGFVVKDNGDGTITTIEGNTSGEAGSSCVAVKTRDRNLVYGYATPVPGGVKV